MRSGRDEDGKIEILRCLDFILYKVWRTFSRDVISDCWDRHFIPVTVLRENLDKVYFSYLLRLIGHLTIEREMNLVL